MVSWVQIAYWRTRQGLRAMTAFLRPVDYQVVAEVLTPELLALFKRMRASEQHHCIRVMTTLQEWGCTNPDLLTAALLHDVGKARYPLTELADFPLIPDSLILPSFLFYQHLKRP